MALLETIAADLKTAMLASDSQTVSVLRLFQAEAKNAHIAKGEALSDQELIQLLRREIKKREEAATLYLNQGQPERAAQETRESQILSQYLPPAADPAELKAFIETRLKELNLEKTPAAQGILIRETMNKFTSAADGKIVSQIVRDVLNS